jgi:hypothetical protein
MARIADLPLKTAMQHFPGEWTTQVSKFDGREALESRHSLHPAPGHKACGLSPIATVLAPENNGGS